MCVQMKRSDRAIFSTKDLATYFQEIVGWKAAEKYDRLPMECVIEIEDDKLLAFFERMSIRKRNKFSRALQRYNAYMIGYFSGEWNRRLDDANFVLLVLIGLIEYVMASHRRYVQLNEFLVRETRAESSVSISKLKKLIEDYHKQYSERSNVKRFFKENLKKESDRLLAYVQTCPDWKSCSTISKFVDHLLRYRHKFVHELSRDALWPSPQKMSYKTRVWHFLGD